MKPIRIRYSWAAKSWYWWCDECKVVADGFPAWSMAMMGTQWHYNQVHKKVGSIYDVIGTMKDISGFWTVKQADKHFGVSGGGAPESNRNL